MIKKFLLLSLSFTLYALGFTLGCYAKDITILYTGDTHAMLYTCSCPIETDGGVARRATLVKQLRGQDPQALLLDSGSFFAGGLMDEYTQNTDLDKERTLVNLKAMGLMKYDAVSVGDDELNFGKDFLLDAISKSKLNFLSTNLKAKEVLPYIMKDVSGTKVAITAVTNLAAKNKVGSLEIADPRAAVAATVQEARKNGANIIVLLSRLGENEDLNLINQIKDIDILIGKSSHEQGPSTKQGNTLILRPSWQGRKLGKATITVKDNKIADSKVDEIGISDKISDDPEILAVLPQCFSDGNCKKKGFIGSCSNPGTLSAKCSFQEPSKINLLVITSKDCVVCNPQSTIDALKKQLPGIVVSYLYHPDKKADKLIKDFDIAGLPVYLFGKEIEKEKHFDLLKEKMEAKGDYYMLKPQFAGLSYFLNRKKIQGKFDLFMSLFDENSSKILEVVKEFNPTIHFLAIEQQGMFGAAAGKLEIEECLRSICVQKHYPEAFWEYISCRAKNINSSWWEDCLGKFNADQIRSCSKGLEGATLLKENISLNKELQIMAGPTYLVDNQQIFSSQGAPSKEELKKAIKR